MEIRRGDIWFVEYEKAIGSEQYGLRPALVVSNDVGNKHAPIVEVVWMTKAQKKPMATHVEIRGYGTALCEQISTIDKSRLFDFQKSISDVEMLQINGALMKSLGIIY